MQADAISRALKFAYVIAMSNALNEAFATSYARAVCAVMYARVFVLPIAYPCVTLSDRAYVRLSLRMTFSTNDRYCMSRHESFET
jgi:hypothetical protein